MENKLYEEIDRLKKDLAINASMLEAKKWEIQSLDREVKRLKAEIIEFKKALGSDTGADGWCKQLAEARAEIERLRQRLLSHGDIETDAEEALAEYHNQKNSLGTTGKTGKS